MGWSVNIGSIAGTASAFTSRSCCFWAGFSLPATPRAAPKRPATSLAFMLLLFACVLAHEFGHIFMARALRRDHADVTLLPIGGVARLERIPEKPLEEFLVRWRARRSMS